MPVSPKIIKGKIKAVANIKKITKAMELVAAGKMKKAVDSAVSSRDYAKLALEVLVSLSSDRDLKHFMLSRGEGEKTLVVAIGTNKGLCGGFNTQLSKQFSIWLGDKNKKDINVITIGKRAEKFSKKNGANVVASFININDKPQIEELNSVSKIILDEYKTNQYKDVYVFYNNFISALRFEPVMRKVLPMGEGIILNMLEDSGYGKEVAERPKAKLYQFEPGVEAVLDAVLPRLLEVIIYQALLESMASEHSSRMVAMKNASENAGKLIEDLTLWYNRGRQAGITREISEIAAGAEALSV